MHNTRQTDQPDQPGTAEHTVRKVTQEDIQRAYDLLGFFSEGDRLGHLPAPPSVEDSGTKPLTIRLGNSTEPAR